MTSKKRNRAPTIDSKRSIKSKVSSLQRILLSVFLGSLLRLRFSGQWRIIHLEIISTDDEHISGDLVTETDVHQVTKNEFLCGDFNLFSITDNETVCRDEILIFYEKLGNRFAYILVRNERIHQKGFKECSGFLLLIEINSSVHESYKYINGTEVNLHTN
jgi:hypothetical protein